MDVGNLERLMPARAEEMYNLLTSYSFARRYTGGGAVLDIGWESIGQGTGLLAESAGSVVGLTGSSEALRAAPELLAAPNVSYQRSDLPKLSHEDSSFDMAAAFEVIEKFDEPEELVTEVKRVLKEGGVFVVSTPDKQAHSNDRSYRDASNKQEMYAPQFREMLERHFAHVELYRQGSAAGGFVLPANGLSEARAETVGLNTRPSPSAEPPVSLFVLAVCSDSAAWKESGGQPYLLLDRDRHIFEEYADSREDVELLREEIQRLQHTEVQAFQDSLRLQSSEGLYLKARLESYEAQVEQHKARIEHLREQNRQLETLKEQNRRLQETVRRSEKTEDRLRAIENSRTWRLFGVYRRLLSRRAR